MNYSGRNALTLTLVLTLHAAPVFAQTPPTPPPPIPLAPPVIPEDKIELRRDVPYADTDHPNQTLDVFLPKTRASSQKLPVVLFIHGGAWKGGNKATGMALLPRLVLTGKYIGVSTAYRLTPEVTWPAPLHDCKAAVRWIKAHAEELGADPERIAVWGSSAGAHLASLLGTTAGDPTLDGTLGKNPKGSTQVRCVVNFYGPQNFLSLLENPNANENSEANSPVGMLLGGAIKDRQEMGKEASPITHVSRGDAPFFTAHGTKDPLVDFSQARQLHAALKKAGVEEHLIEMTDAGHGFRSPELDSRLDQFLEKHLWGKPSEISVEPIPKGR